MPSIFLNSSDANASPLQSLGAQIRAQRKALRLSATVTAEAAGVSRVTLHRIEKGEPSVTMGAWCSAMAALGLGLQTQKLADERAPTAQAPGRAGWVPARVVLADYPQLRALAWHVHGTDSLTPSEALDIYERNARHLDPQTMSANERALLAALPLVLARSPSVESGGGSAI